MMLAWIGHCHTEYLYKKKSSKQDKPVIRESLAIKFRLRESPGVDCLQSAFIAVDTKLIRSHEEDGTVSLV